MNAIATRLVSLLAAAAVAGSAHGFTLDSPQIKANGTVPDAQVYARCGGGNVSPQLAWRDPPGNARSFAVSVFDPDAPGGGFWHWVAFDIDVGAHGLNAGAGTPRSGNAPGDTVQLVNGFGERGYSGPCPPAGAPHRYVFTVYALDVPKLGLDAGTDAGAAVAAIRRHALASASLTASYARH